MSDTTNLRIPGPTPAARIGPRGRLASDGQPPWSRVQGAAGLASPSGLQRGFRTSNDVLLLTASGTGGLEAVVVNFLSPGDQVLSVSIGVFGDRFAAIATRYGVDVDKYAVEWGQAAEPAVVGDHLRALAAAGTPARAVLVTHNETSTGVTNPLAEIAAVIHGTAPDALIIVDGISGLGAVPFETDGWGLDVVATGSQKSWMVPPGLAMVSVSPRAWAATETASMPALLLRPARGAKDAAAKGETPWTPAVGVASRSTWRSSSSRPRATRPSSPATRRAPRRPAPASSAMGFRLFADPAHASNTVTSALRARRRRVVGAEQGAARPRPRARRRPGRPDRQDLPGRPPRRRARGRHPARARDARGRRRRARHPGRQGVGVAAARQAAAGSVPLEPGARGCRPPA